MLIPLTQGQFAIIDDVDLPLIGDLKWQAKWCKRGKRYYASQMHTGNDGITKYRLMHRVILNAPRGVSVDHKNRNGLDNRRTNLRLATRSENQANSLPPPGVHGFRGVRKTKYGWRAVITKDKKQILIGRYNTKEDAAAAYNIKAAEIFGEFATLNNIQGELNPQKYKRKQASETPGVSYSATRNRWRAYLTINGKRTHIGWFRDEGSAVNSLQLFKQD